MKEQEGIRTRLADVVRISLMPFVLCAFAPCPSRASDFELLSVGVRTSFSQARVLGQEQPESFREYDVVTTTRLPWKPWEEEISGSGWEIGTRLLASIGALKGKADKAGLVVSAIPVLALARQDGRFTLDLGAGFALLGKPGYAHQDFGGALQFALTLGLSVPLYERIGVGYRFLHYSDGGAYGHEKTGVDFHMIELTYRF
jgi:hypothetical protein